MLKLIAGAILDFVFGLIGKAFPAFAPPDPKQQAQAEKDRADSAESLLKARIEGDAIENRVRADAASNPGSLRDHDKFEIKH